MKIIFDERAWEDYLFWQETDKKLAAKINALIKDCSRSPFSGLGKPEPLRGRLSGSGGPAESTRNTGSFIGWKAKRSRSRNAGIIIEALARCAPAHDLETGPVRAREAPTVGHFD